MRSKKLATMALAMSLGTFGAAVPNALAAPPQANRGNAVQITGQPTVTNMNGNSATITWQTNVSSASRVHYGTNPNNLSQDATAAWGGTTHNVTLKNLQPGQTYYYTVESGHASGSGTTATSPVQQFQMTGRNAGAGSSSNNGGQQLPGEQPSTRTDNVVIQAGPVVQNLTGTSATLWWQTDDRAATDVRYGTSPNNMTQRAYERGGDRNHTAELTNLQPGQTYYWQMLRRDGTVRTTGQFMTPQTNAANTPGYPNTGVAGQPQYPGGMQITSGPVMGFVGPNAASVQWTTAQPANSFVRYGTDPNNLNQMAQGPAGSTQHQVQLNNLQPNTRYYFMVLADQNANPANPTMAQGYPGQFQTVAQGQQPVTIFGIPVTPRR